MEFANMMRRSEPAFGSACYVDSSPLPNDEKDNPFNALRCERGKGCSIEMRLGLVLDEMSDYPVWFQTFAGNNVDSTKFFDALDGVRAALGIDVISVVVDAGYINKEVAQKYANSNARSFLARMPHRRGYPYDSLYAQNKEKLYDIRYDFLQGGKAYFGICNPITLFDVPMYAFVYLDKSKALHESEKYRQEHETEYLKMNDAEKTWCCVRFGFFILVSNIESSPADVLADYIRRVSIEAVLKTGKAYLALLPLSRWTYRRVCGKLLEDMIAATIRMQMYKVLPDSEHDLMDWFHMAAALDCDKVGAELRVNTPNRQANEAFLHFGEATPVNINLEKWRSDIMPPKQVDV